MPFYFLTVCSVAVLCCSPCCLKQTAGGGADVADCEVLLPHSNTPPRLGVEAAVCLGSLGRAVRLGGRVAAGQPICPLYLTNSETP